MMTFHEKLLKAEQQYRDGSYREALKNFHNLASECPVEEEMSLSRIFYYIGRVLLKLGLKQEALTTWKSSLRIVPEGKVREQVLGMINSYGMISTDEPANDDFKAFASIQISRYLLAKRKGCFACLAEADMVMDLISDHWHDFLDSGLLDASSIKVKLELFQRYQIDFPVRKEYQHVEICYDFRRKKVMESDDPCQCGSGLPHYACCGAITDPLDYITGLK